MKNYYEVHGEKIFIRLDRKDGSHDLERWLQDLKTWKEAD